MELVKGITREVFKGIETELVQGIRTEMVKGITVVLGDSGYGSVECGVINDLV